MNEKYPLVSVAIITYNQKEYLKECIESVLEQDYPNIEIVVADDASTDGTQEMLKEYSKKYPNKFVLKLSEKNQGITKNSNLAHFACSGKYVAWMGGDDLMLPGKIRKQVEYMEKHIDCVICHHNLEVFNSDTGELIKYIIDGKKKLSGDVRDLISEGNMNGACATMVRRNKTPKNGFNKKLPVASDWFYWIECLINGGKICYIDEVLGKYRKHGTNVTTLQNDKAFMDHYISCMLVIDKYPQFGKYAFKRLSKLFFGKRKVDNYFENIIISMKFNLFSKNIIALLLYTMSLKKIKV